VLAAFAVQLFNGGGLPHDPADPPADARAAQSVVIRQRWRPGEGSSTRGDWSRTARSRGGADDGSGAMTTGRSCRTRWASHPLVAAMKAATLAGSAFARRPRRQDRVTTPARPSDAPRRVGSIRRPAAAGVTVHGSQSRTGPWSCASVAYRWGYHPRYSTRTLWRIALMAYWSRIHASVPSRALLSSNTKYAAH
jgi:hypothetical protein